MRREPGRSVLWLCGVLLWAAGAAFGCHRRSDSEVVARLVELTGSAERDFAAQPRRWSAARLDAQFSMGDGLKTASVTTARVRLTRGATLKLGSNTELRFLRPRAAREGQRISIETGEAEIEAGDQLVLFDASFGQVRVERGTVLRLSREGDRTRLDVEVGSAVLERDGGTVQLGRGESFVVDVGGAVIEHTRAPLPSPARAAAPPAEPPAIEPSRTADSALAKPSLSAELPGAAAADVSVNAGESPVIHDVRAPTAVRIQAAGLCPGDALVEVLKAGSYRRAALASPPSNTTTVVLGPGAHRYRVRCVDDDAAEPSPVSAGTLNIVRDSGAARLTRKAPSNSIDADGRKYRVLYQSLLPELTFHWPDAPQGATIVLQVEPQRGSSLRVPAPGGTRAFKSGEFREGTYSFWFEATEGAGVRSPTTTLHVAFDNAAPAAEIQSPGIGSRAPGGPIDVAGLALEGARVSVGGVVLPLDPERRFHAQVMPNEADALSIRIAYPKRGVHYYVRRFAP